MTACKGECNRRAQPEWDAFRAALTAYDQAMLERTANPSLPEPEPPVHPRIRLWPGEPVFCGRCFATYRRLLAELGDLAAIAEAENLGYRRRPDDEQRVSGSRGAPSPSPVGDSLDALAAALRSWQAIALDDSETPPRAGELLPEIGTLIARLSARHYGRLMCDPEDGPEFAAQIREWHARLKKATSAGTGRHASAMPCSRCRERSLEWHDGADYVECGNKDTCGRLMKWDEYDAEYAEWLARRQAGREPIAA